MSTLHLYSAADGRRLDGRKGKNGIVHVAFRENDTYDKPRVAFYPGTAGAHAVQMNSSRLTADSLGYLGGFTGGTFFDPRTLDELRFPERIRFRRNDERLDMLWRGQTHVAWNPVHPRRFIVAIGELFWEYDLDNPKHPRQRLGRHGVTIPHALKRIGNYLVYGAMDSNTTGPARCIGIYDLRTDKAEVVELDDTAWHLTVGKDHQGRECAWVVTECYEQGPAKQGQPFNFDDLAIGYRINWVWKVNLQTLKVTGICADPDMPSHMSADVVALGDARGTVLHACCASATIGISEVNTGRIRYIDERVGVAQLMRHPGLLRSLGSNLVAAGSMMHLPGNTHHLANALLASRWPRNHSDGVYGLVLNEKRTRLFAGHRGLNQIIVRDFSALREDDDSPFVKLPIVARIQLPPLRKFFPKHVSILGDPRLGLHHMTSLVEET